MNEEALPPSTSYFAIACLMIETGGRKRSSQLGIRQAILCSVMLLVDYFLSAFVSARRRTGKVLWKRRILIFCHTIGRIPGGILGSSHLQKMSSLVLAICGKTQSIVHKVKES